MSFSEAYAAAAGAPQIDASDYEQALLCLNTIPTRELKPLWSTEEREESLRLWQERVREHISSYSHSVQKWVNYYRSVD